MAEILVIGRYMKYSPELIRPELIIGRGVRRQRHCRTHKYLNRRGGKGRDAVGGSQNVWTDDLQVRIIFTPNLHVPSIFQATALAEASICMDNMNKLWDDLHQM